MSTSATPPTTASLARALADLIDEGSLLIDESHSVYYNGRAACVLGTAAVGALSRCHGAAWPEAAALWDSESCLIAIANYLNVSEILLHSLTKDLERRHYLAHTSRADLAASLRALAEREGAA